MKKLLNKIIKPFKKWATRKTTLWYAIVTATLYMIISTIYTMKTSNYLDSTTTTAYFGILTSVIAMGGGITIAEFFKKKKEEYESKNENNDEESKG